MTQVLSPSDADVKDFTSHRDVRFRIDDDIFYGVKDIPALELLEVGTTFDGLSATEIANQPDAFHRMFSLMLTEDSVKVFLRRMKDWTNPISLPQVMDILPWLMEEYGMRPTEPSSASSTGSANLGDGKSSTASASIVSLTSTPTDS